MFLIKTLLLSFLCITLLSLAASVGQKMYHHEPLSQRGWWAARSDSAGLAPDPRKNARLALVQVYAAPTWGWKGVVAVHPWIIYKRAGETHYTRYEVISWGAGKKVRRNQNVPDGYWYGSKPRLLVEHRGKEAEAMIPQIEAAIASWPWPDTYRVWPGPNSNTFIAHIGREVPALKLDLPANAIGKDFRPLRHVVGLPPSGRGVQVSVLGVAGFTLGAEEGLEINILGLNMGLDLSPLKLRLPFIGGVGSDNLQKNREGGEG
ncbi:DUF3750 domain-containing protein [Cronobacter sakazakii]|uniref:DUF3750 domain-containing protein n=1 Tax=Cronobacter sakazakii TaxID=28141 RepID=A0AAN5X4S5_CROSK|nr:DUF3750 domain-containing protein [Cronobacter sakazakii]EGT4274797.1 DUF3750 domain-containing protein [Cronobacter sakazakii]EGT5692562.1 DUF3750 domain-containing protein [Cronobacter sakazakii]EGT5703760.1 DUF3750 domain-containing protein [Cronobacter sakazakii]EGT5718572.1 DUF3750 domain-containing protein [Cronobacter sakazakii]EGT5721687.1 DUF3750 domain-containing protein [Cronobacter sakazakii]